MENAEDIKKTLENEVIHYQNKNAKDAMSVRMRKTLWACECEKRYERARDATSI